jgi:hypothetical protein
MGQLYADPSDPSPGQFGAASPAFVASLAEPESMLSRTTDFTGEQAARPLAVPRSPSDTATLPSTFGRYLVRRALGTGGFGTMYRNFHNGTPVYN